MLDDRPKGGTDDQVPAGSSVMVEVYLKFEGLTGDPNWRRLTRDTVRLVHGSMPANPLRHGWMLGQLEALKAEPQEIAIVGDPG